MPIQNLIPTTMRMNVSQFLMYNLGLKNCDYNPIEKQQDIKKLSNDNSMQCCMNNIKDSTQQQVQVLKFKSEQEEPKAVEIQQNNQIVETLPKHNNFIPYPDHNYGQQPPLTPPEETPKVEELVPVETVEEEKEEVEDNSLVKEPPPDEFPIKEEDEEQEGVTRCICGFEHDDGYMICCDNCSSWQHIECMGIKSSKVPEKYSCHKCSPRELDIEGAKSIQAKKRDNMSEDDDEEDEETCSEDETSSKTMYTAISNTPTRITLLSNTSQQSTQGALKNRNRKGNRITKKKLSDQRNTRRKTKKKEKADFADINGDHVLFPDSSSLNDYISAHKLYEEIEENKYDEEFKNMHFKLPEAVPSIDFKNIVKCHQVSDVSNNRKGLVASFDIPGGNFILEYKGTLMSRKKFEDSCYPIIKNNCPYIVNYSKIDHMLLVIDARDYGNDARFVRRSCSPNAELQHITSNGALHIMVISKVDILQKKEITVPFDFHLNYYQGHVECACNLEDCCLKKKNEDLKQANNIINNTTDLISNHILPIPPEPNENAIPTTIKKDEIEELLIESESEMCSAGCEESRHEKLSREERKLQAYMKQFEKLEKKLDTTGKKGHHQAKTPVLKVTPDENISIEQTPPGAKPTPPKKVAGGKRKICFSAKRRTRQSSCSSEPVSPTDQPDHQVASGCVTTPTTPVAVVTTTTMQPELPHVLVKQRSRKESKEKEPLTLTLPLQRKTSQEHPVDNPTPPVTPSIALLTTSPAKQQPVSQQLSSLPLSVDTSLESIPIQTTNSDGLLQIAQQAPNTPLAIVTSSSGASTSDEKIGDVTLRTGDFQAQPNPPKAACTAEVPKPPPVKPTTYVPHEGNLQRRYYGSIKKHWLRRHEKKEADSSSPKVQPTGLKQISLAALVASLSQQNLSSPCSNNRRTSSCTALLKRRHLLSSQNSQNYKTFNAAVPAFNAAVPAACYMNDLHACSIVSNNQDLLTRSNSSISRGSYHEPNLLSATTNFERISMLTHSNFDYITSVNYTSNNMGLQQQERTTFLPNTMENILPVNTLTGSNTRLTYSLTPPLDSRVSENTNAPPIVSPLHSIISEKTSQLQTMVEEPLKLQQNNNASFSAEVHSVIDSSNNERLCSVLNAADSQFQSGIEICSAEVNCSVNSNTTSFSRIETPQLLTSPIQQTHLLSTTTPTIITSPLPQQQQQSENCELSINTTTITTTATTSQLYTPLESEVSPTSSATTELRCQETPPDNEPSEEVVEMLPTDQLNIESNVESHNSSVDSIEIDTDTACDTFTADDAEMTAYEPSCKKPRIEVDDETEVDDESTSEIGEVDDESTSEIGLKIVISEAGDVSDTCFSSTIASDSLLISAESNCNSLENVSLCNDTKFVTTSLQTGLGSNIDTFSNSSISLGDAGTGGRKKLSFKEYRNRRSKASTSNLTLTESNLHHLPSMPISPAQKISEAAGQLLTPRTLSLLNVVEKPSSELYTNNLDSYLPTTSHVLDENEMTIVVSTECPPLLDSSETITSDLSNETHDEANAKSDSSCVKDGNTLVDSTVKNLAYNNNVTFEPVSPGNDYENDVESPMDDSVAYLNTIHTDITKNPFSIHNDITKHPFGKKHGGQLQDRGQDIVEQDDDASSTHSNMSSTSYGSISEVAHERPHRSYSRENNTTREYTSRDTPQEDPEYYPNSTHPTFGVPQTYYQSYNQSMTPSISRTSTSQRITAFPTHNNYNTLSANQTPRQRQTNRGYIPF